MLSEPKLNARQKKTFVFCVSILRVKSTKQHIWTELENTTRTKLTVHTGEAFAGGKVGANMRNILHSWASVSISLAFCAGSLDCLDFLYSYFSDNHQR